MATSSVGGTAALKNEVLLSTKRRTPLGDAYHALVKNKAAVVSAIFIILLILVAIFADTTLFSWVTGNDTRPLLAPYGYGDVDFLNTDAPPGTRTEEDRYYIAGTDYLGRDNLSRTLYGSRISLAVAIVAATVSLLVGLVYGLIAGYGSSLRDNLMMRLVDFLYGFPLIIFIILIQVSVKAFASDADLGGFWGYILSIDKALGGIFFIFVALGLINWLGMARIARGQTLSIKNKEFVEAARSIGSNDSRIIFKHILPNILGPCIVFETLAIPGYILTEAFLSFIGLGANPPTPSWGMMISETFRAVRTAPWEVFTPAIALTLTTLAFNFLGDGLRDSFDPRLRGE